MLDVNQFQAAPLLVLHHHAGRSATGMLAQKHHVCPLRRQRQPVLDQHLNRIQPGIRQQVQQGRDTPLPTPHPPTETGTHGKETGTAHSDAAQARAPRPGASARQQTHVLKTRRPPSFNYRTQRPYRPRPTKPGPKADHMSNRLSVHPDRLHGCDIANRTGAYGEVSIWGNAPSRVPYHWINVHLSMSARSHVQVITTHLGNGLPDLI